MKRRKKITSNYKIIRFLILFLLMLSGIYYLGLNYVPQKWYDIQTMMPNQKESYYLNQWCTTDFGRKEVVLWDSTRVDCLTKDYAIEFDFAKKWAEAIGQSLYYSKMTGKKPAIALILSNINDYKYLKRIERLDNGIQLFLIKAY